ncbi:MAG: hypothetical protein AAGG01_22665, partial [Planctomycetota bacterium]
FVGWEWKHLQVRADQALARWSPVHRTYSALDRLRVDSGTRQIFAGTQEGIARLGWRRPQEGRKFSSDDLFVHEATEFNYVSASTWLPGAGTWILGDESGGVRTMPAIERASRPDLLLGSEISFLHTVASDEVLAARMDGKLTHWNRSGDVTRTHALSVDPLIWCGSQGTTFLALSETGTFFRVDGRRGTVLDEVNWQTTGGKVNLLDLDLAAGTALVGDAAGGLHETEIRSGKIRRFLASPGGRVEHGARSADGTLLFSGGQSDEFLTVHDLATGQILERLSGHSAPIASVASFPSKGLILAGDEEGILAAWDPVFHSGVMNLVGHEDDVWTLAPHRDGRLLVSAGRDGMIIVWDLFRQRPWRVFRSPSSGVTNVILREDVDEILASCQDGFVYRFNYAEGLELGRRQLGYGSVYDVAWDPARERIYASTRSGLTILDEDLRLVSEWTDHPGGFGALTLADDARTLYSIRESAIEADGDQGELVRIDLTSMKVLWKNTHPTSSTPSLGLSPDGKTVVFTSGKDQIGFLDRDDGSLIRSLPMPSSKRARDVVLRVAYGPGSDRLIVTSTQGTAYFLDQDRNALALALDAHESYATALAVSGDHVFTSAADRVVRAWHH